MVSGLPDLVLKLCVCDRYAVLVAHRICVGRQSIRLSRRTRLEAVSPPIVTDMMRCVSLRLSLQDLFTPAKSKG